MKKYTLILILPLVFIAGCLGGSEGNVSELPPPTSVPPPTLSPACWWSEFDETNQEIANKADAVQLIKDYFGTNKTFEESSKTDIFNDLKSNLDLSTLNEDDITYILYEDVPHQSPPPGPSEDEYVYIDKTNTVMIGEDGIIYRYGPCPT